MPADWPLEKAWNSKRGSSLVASYCARCRRAILPENLSVKVTVNYDFVASALQLPQPDSKLAIGGYGTGVMIVRHHQQRAESNTAAREFRNNFLCPFSRRWCDIVHGDDERSVADGNHRRVDRRKSSRGRTHSEKFSMPVSCSTSVKLCALHPSEQSRRIPWRKVAAPTIATGEGAGCLRGVDSLGFGRASRDAATRFSERDRRRSSRLPSLLDPDKPFASQRKSRRPLSRSHYDRTKLHRLCASRADCFGP